MMRFFVSAVILLSLSRAHAQTPAETVKEQFAKRAAKLWSLQPVTKPTVPIGVTASTNPIDAFIAADYKAKGLVPAGKADKLTLLRRVYLDLIGLPPTPAEQEAFLADTAPDAYEKTVDRLLDNEQHGVRWSRYWLDILRYADLDGLDGSVMPAAPGIYLWRDWVIQALNHDMPYDQFVRAQILGNRYRPEIATNASGRRTRVEGSVEDSFALGFLARSAVTRNDKDHDIPFAAVETISSAFMGMTVGCAKCHDHKFDPITQKDFYSMKAIFDPLVLKSVMLATPAEIFANGQRLDEFKSKSAPVNAAIEALTGPYQTRLYNERVALLTPEVQAIIRKPERDRTPEEQKIFDDYYPVLRIDPDKIKEVMPKEDIAKYNALLKQQSAIARPLALASYWTVEEDPSLLKQKSYVLTTGDPAKPEKDNPVEPGFPFQPANLDFRDGRRETFVEWLTAPANPLFARVAVNRVWGWHFGEGLQRATSDFGLLGGKPSNQNAAGLPGFGICGAQLQHEVAAPPDRDLRYLPTVIESRAGARFTQRCRLTRRIPISGTSACSDWPRSRFGIPSISQPKIWILRWAESRSSFRRPIRSRRFFFPKMATSMLSTVNRRGVYMVRGYIPSTDVMNNFLTSFDVDDGRTPCPVRTQTVTAPQALFTMNGELVEKESEKLAALVLKDSSGDLRAAVTEAYQRVLGRKPSASETDYSLTYIDKDPARMKELAWLLFNLDEFIYVR